MTNDNQIREILIVGGGSAGWMTAATLARGLGQFGCKVTLIESADIGTVGVGEATTPEMTQFVQHLDLDPDDFMRRCQATYKLAIRFVNWVGDNDEYWHPFGPVGGYIDGWDLFHFWNRLVREGQCETKYCEFSVHQQLAQQGKAPRSGDEPSHIIKRGSYAFHLDTTAFAAMLKSIALGKGVVHFFDEVSDVKLDHDGAVASVQTKSGRELTADLYVDCTGFHATLIEQAMGDTWIDWSELLLCNQALVASVPHGEIIRPYTTSTTLSAGWVWEIPLSHRLSTGYVYSDKFIEQERAQSEFAEFLSARGVESVRPRSISFRVGRRENFWYKNCVSIGLAAGFIEPLESTGLALVARGARAIMQFLPDCHMNPLFTDGYNREMGARYAEIRDFIILHYLLNRKTNSEFWQASREIDVPQSLARSLELYDYTGTLDHFPKEVFGEPSYFCICSGANRLPQMTLPLAAYPETAKILHVMSQIKTQNDGFVQEMPPHEDLIAEIHQTRKKLL